MGFFLKIFLYAAIIMTIAICIWQFFLLDINKCPVENQVELTGFFKGYRGNNTFDGYTDILLDNNTYTFYRVDRDYLKSILGFNISIVSCERIDLLSNVGLYYDMIEAYITDKK